jgi:ribosomal protein S18 acetylase RimI-like enzyme
VWRPDLRRVRFRYEVEADDPARIRAMVLAAANFSPAEVDIAEELARERLARGAASGYEFVFAEDGDALLGYACFGPIPGTRHRFDLYWIAVLPDAQRSGIGAALLNAAERAMRDAGGARVYVDTSTSVAYAPARGFYARMGYARAAELTDFYADGDGKVVFVKTLAAIR